MTRQGHGLKLSLFSVFLMLGLTYAQAEPLVREAPRAGGPIDGITASDLGLFGLGQFLAGVPHSVSGTEAGAPANGLGPRFNGVSCLACHAQPAAGGTSPAVNPQVELATHFGAVNKIPFFVKLNGPIREARFRFNPDGTPDGGVHDLYTITGRQDAVGCSIAQPDFDAAMAAGNLSLRIPSPMFGGGLVEMIEDSTILANKTTKLTLKRKLGISGKENRNGNDGSVTRFGWKAQNQSLEMFSSEAYNVETGVTNDIFQIERDETPGCVFNPLPEDTASFSAPPPFAGLSAMVGFVQFNKFLAPPTRGPETDSTRNGEKLFNKVGCALCHVPAMMTGGSQIAAFDHKPVNLFSDLLLHHMGPGLADHISQGNALGDEFRTSPLWGVGQRLFFLHDGRTNDLMTAIREHASPDKDCEVGSGEDSSGVRCRSEADGVIAKFEDLSRNERQDIVNFLKVL